MGYTPQTIHSGNRGGGLSTKDAQDLATALEGLDTAIAAVGDLTALTDNTGGTAGDTIADLGATYDQAKVENAIASLAAKVNAIIAALA